MVQDDARENELIELFDLERPPGAGRGDTDAILQLDGQVFEFELKSTTRGSVTTVRDFGPDHIAKWQSKHWLIGVYDRGGRTLKYCLYGSPTAMNPWISEKADYIRPDFQMADLVSSLIGEREMQEITGAKNRYTLEDAKALQKKQYHAQDYHSMMDLVGGYSPERMLEIVRDRAAYLIRRGSTLNNPHIPESYFRDWERITDLHAERLRRMVREWIHLSTD